jgi:hypothetical protein
MRQRVSSNGMEVYEILELAGYVIFVVINGLVVLGLHRWAGRHWKTLAPDDPIPPGLTRGIQALVLLACVVAGSSIAWAYRPFVSMPKAPFSQVEMLGMGPARVEPGQPLMFRVKVRHEWTKRPIMGAKFGRRTHTDENGVASSRLRAGVTPVACLSFGANALGRRQVVAAIPRVFAE